MHYLLNMQVKCQEISRPLLYWQKSAATCWKAFSRKNTDRKKGQANRKVCSVTKATEGRRQCFGAPNLKLPYVLKNVSRHSTQSYILK